MVADIFNKKNKVTLVKESSENSLKSHYRNYMKFFDVNIIEGNIEISSKLSELYLFMTFVLIIIIIIKSFDIVIIKFNFIY